MIKAVEELYLSENAGERLTMVKAEEFEENESKWVEKMLDFFPGVAD
jgi:hypothetical protein